MYKDVLAHSLSSSFSDLSGCRAIRGRRTVGKRQLDREARTDVHRASDFHRAAKVLHDTVDERQTEPCALARIFRCEERIKDFFEILWRDADASVFDLIVAEAL